MMTLREFFLQPDAPSQAAFARQLGVSRQAVNAWVSGRNGVPGPVGLEIVRITGGKVTFEDLYGKPALTPDAKGNKLECVECPR